ncbi:MAG: hypothetical protein DI598_15075 [Pseudopedobacter saltans]|uniref:Outer membrane protein beta-barrel domain-containing protein n=1 Tax=Pseudopedobacter saltans TaxID=151895 RepID=A0A2W5GPI3_9SPHI|nr:MAG: hypothetical protein DI598_15075 [Pseudopedobacter saltans]
MNISIKVVMLSLFVSFLISNVASYAQSTDSTKSTQNSIAKDINNQFPSTRLLDIQYDQMGEYNYTTKIDDKIYETGRIVSQNRLKVAMNYNLIQKKNWNLSGTARYKYEHLAFENIDVPSGGVPTIASGRDVHFHYLWASLNYTRYDKLWGKPFVSNISISADGSNKNFGMVYGSYIGSLVLKRNEATTVTVGLVLQSNANAVAPILPSFSYMHSFQNSPWMLDVILPKQIYIRRQLFKHGRLSIGSELEANPYYFKSDFLANNNKSYMFNRNEFKNSVMYEYRINKKFVVYGRSGWIKPLNGTIREKYKSDKLATTSYQGNFYFNVGISYNPFK